VAQLYGRYEAIAAAPSLDALIPLGKRIIIAPDRLDGGYEQWLRFGAALYRR